MKVKMAALGRKAPEEARRALQEKLDGLILEADLEEYHLLRKEWKDTSADLRNHEKALVELRKNANKEADEATQPSPRNVTRAQKKKKDQEAMPAPAPVDPDERKSQKENKNNTPRTKKKGRSVWKDFQRQPPGKASTQLSLEDSFNAGGTYDIRDQLTLSVAEQVELSAEEAEEAVFQETKLLDRENHF